MKKEKILVLTIAGGGKTYLAENYSNVVDFESLYHLWNYDEDVKHWPIEKHKGIPNRKPNPDFPWNYIEDVKNELKKGRIVVTPGMPNNIFALCVVGAGKLGKDVRVILAMPHEDDFETLAERFRARGNADTFIEMVRGNFKRVHEFCKTNTGFEYLIIPPKKYLFDALIEYGIKLIPGKGLIKENRDGGRHLEEKYKKEINKKQKYIIDIPAMTIKEL